MEGMSFVDYEGASKELGQLLVEHKGQKVVVLDLRSLNTWTDFFIIATTTSYTHQQGLHKYIKEYAANKNLTILHRHRRSPADDEWSLIDMGPIVIHLMSDRARSFYELERLWNGAPVIWKEGE